MGSRANGLGLTLLSPAASTRILVTGGAGFIASNLIDRLLALGHIVTAYDNLSTGQMRFIESAQQSPRFQLVHADLLDSETLARAMDNQDMVFHLAANADVRFGIQHPARDLEQNVIATHNLLEAMRQAGVEQLAFSSTGSVYGEPNVFPTPEDCPMPVQTSLYGASKAAAEGFISAYCEGFNFRAQIFRFVSLLGERYSHGHVFDFYRKLQADPTRIEVLGDGQQRKSYLYIQDCVDAMLLAVDRSSDRLSIYNLGTDEYCTVDQSLTWICEELGVRPRREYTGGDRGWIGDNPFIFLDCSRIRSLGWTPKVSIEQGVRRTLSYLRQADWLVETRV